MTYHMEQLQVLPPQAPQPDSNTYTDPGGKPSSKVTFPYKLWDILNNSLCHDRIIWWSENGLSVVTEPEKYEHNVMRRYPDFVRIPSFANLRRQMRWYNFEWETDECGYFIFSHPDFQRGREDLLTKVQPRKHAGRKMPSPRLYLDGSGPPHKKRRRAVLEYEQVMYDTSDTSSDANIRTNGDEGGHVSATRKSRSIETQTAFTMSPYDTEFIGTLNDGSHYYDFYSSENSSQVYSNFCQPNIAPNANQFVQQSVPLSEISIYDERNCGMRLPMNVFQPEALEGMGSPEQLCLQGYQKPIICQVSQAQLAMKDEVGVALPKMEAEIKENLLNL